METCAVEATADTFEWKCERALLRFREKGLSVLKRYLSWLDHFTPAGSISLTAPWDYAQMAGANGASAWVGDTHALVIDAAGNVFKGPLTGGAVQ